MEDSFYPTLHTWFGVKSISAFECKAFFKWCQCPMNIFNVHIYLRNSLFIHFVNVIKVSFSHFNAMFSLHFLYLNYFAFFYSSYFAIGWTFAILWTKAHSHSSFSMDSIFAFRAIESFQNGNPFVMARDSGWWCHHNTHSTTQLLPSYTKYCVCMFHLVRYKYINVFFNSSFFLS